MHVHARQLSDVRIFDEQIERLALVDEGAALGGHVDQRAHRQLPRGAIDRLEFVRYGGDVLDRAFGQLDRVAYLRGPQAQAFEFFGEMAVHLQEITGQRFALEQVRYLRLNAFVATGNGRDRG